MKEKCEHENLKQVITAKKVEIQCASRGCNEIIEERRRVLSSNVFAVGRVEGKHTTVQFMMKGGPAAKAYIFYDVPKSEHEKFMKAKSKGGFFAAHIRDQYDYEKLDY